MEGWRDVADELNALSFKQDWDQMRKLFTEEMVHRIAIVGRYHHIARAIEERLSEVNRIRLNLPIDTGAQQQVVRDIITDIEMSLAAKGSSDRVAASKP